MTRVRVDLGARGYDVVVGEGAHGALGDLLAGRRRAAIVTQRGIDTHWGDGIRAHLDAAGIASDTFTVGDGEPAKSLATVATLASQLVVAGLARDDVVVALGGGLVGDVAGFTAAVYHRGIDVVQVPTTLLAMVDAAIGGKTGVNLPEGKNLVGAFHQPVGVLADPAVLRTLPDGEYRSGLGELAKYALLGDGELAGLVEHEAAALRDRDPAVLATAIVAAVRVKAAVVAADEHERLGLRARLNYGHTLGHALEVVGGHQLRHGEAVAIGLVFAGALAGALGRIDAGEAARHRTLVAAMGLPTTIPAGLRTEELLEVMRRDKKATGGLAFELAGPAGVGRVDDPPAAALAAAFAAVGAGDGAAGGPGR